MAPSFSVFGLLQRLLKDSSALRTFASSLRSITILGAVALTTRSSVLITALASFFAITSILDLILSYKRTGGAREGSSPGGRCTEGERLRGHEAKRLGVTGGMVSQGYRGPGEYGGAGRSS